MTGTMEDVLTICGAQRASDIIVAALPVSLLARDAVEDTWAVTEPHFAEGPTGAVIVSRVEADALEQAGARRGKAPTWPKVS